ncbi:hypothetical protein NEOLEDRAFT_1134628 [Neolentinus lepideus HHB14362 ss-1]|uniref:Uncharacterized protein n=1 Tax=Neolentinus lepideus HHB14362 ss-1 TaxID=1314782 RepID=A0A165S371_9AGAM|nr:hypothetical protein NEOLEDRAFT_1134628 [Neolentinus lepideus HHB14362 ss-1]
MAATSINHRTYANLRDCHAPDGLHLVPSSASLSPFDELSLAKCYCGAPIDIVYHATGAQYCSPHCEDTESFAAKNVVSGISYNQPLLPPSPAQHAEPVFSTGLSVILAKQREAQLRAAGLKYPEEVVPISATCQTKPCAEDTKEELKYEPSLKPNLRAPNSSVDATHHTALTNGMVRLLDDPDGPRSIPYDTGAPLNLMMWVGARNAEDEESKQFSPLNVPLDVRTSVGLEGDDSEPVPKLSSAHEMVPVTDPSVPLDLLSWVGAKNDEDSVWNPAAEGSSIRIGAAATEGDASLRAPTPSKTRPVLDLDPAASTGQAASSAQATKHSKPVLHGLITDAVLRNLHAKELK